jgi:hypothetical protein
MDLAGHVLVKLGRTNLAVRHYRNILSQRHHQMERVFGASLAALLYPAPPAPPLRELLFALSNCMHGGWIVWHRIDLHGGGGLFIIF